MKNFMMTAVAMVVAMVAAVSFSSCSKDNDNLVPNNQETQKQEAKAKSYACMMIITDKNTRDNFDIRIQVDGKTVNVENKDTIYIESDATDAPSKVVEFRGGLTPKVGVDPAKITEKCIMKFGFLRQSNNSTDGHIKASLGINLADMSVNYSTRTPEKMERILNKWKIAFDRNYTLN